MPTYLSPAGNPEVWDAPPPGYFTEEEWVAAHPPPAPTPEERALARDAARRADGEAALARVMRAAAAASPDFSDAEVAAVAATGVYPAWAAGASYRAGDRLTHGDDFPPYRVVQDVAFAVAGHEPGQSATLALYQPVDDGHAGTLSDPKRLVPGLAVEVGLFYVWGGAVWRLARELGLAYAGREPGAPGMESYWTRIDGV